MEQATTRGAPAVRESLVLRRVLGDGWGIANCLNNLGVLALEQGDYARAPAVRGEPGAAAPAR
jgi:hypothetical protein